MSATDQADALVVFGITGDLARKMTFRSLYRLERRNLLKLPVFGVAADDWSLDRLLDRLPGVIDEAVDRGGGRDD
jgi:glucose-6-phosphate 1-dehydrogenase